jgi:hypothetical protein
MSESFTTNTVSGEKNNYIAVDCGNHSESKGKMLKYQPVQSQPYNVMKVHRYYAQSKYNKNYKRRVKIWKHSDPSEALITTKNVSLITEAI